MGAVLQFVLFPAVRVEILLLAVYYFLHGKHLLVHRNKRGSGAFIYSPFSSVFIDVFSG